MTGEFESLLEKLITLMIDKKTSASVSVGVVSNIDKTENTCDVLIADELTLHGVRMQSVINDEKSHFVVYPAADSQVLVVMIGKDKAEGFLLACSEVEEVSIVIDKQTLTANADGFTFSDGTNELELIGWAKKVSSDFDTLKSLLSTSTVAGNGAVLGITFTPTATI